MRFISKNSNLRIVLKPGLPAEPLAGRLAEPGVSVKFQSGVADVSDEEIIKKMQAHSGFNSDFIAVEEVTTDPYASFREESEPAHVITEIKYGHVEKSVSSPRKLKVPAEIEGLINAKAVEIAKSLLPKMIEETLKGLMGAAKTKGEDSGAAPLTAEGDSQDIAADPAAAMKGVSKKRGRKPATVETSV